MDFNLIWKAVLIVLVGTFLLRIAGRKTISQMTLAETVLMISIGTLIIQPVTNKSVWASFIVGAVLVLTLLAMEFSQLKIDTLEKLITGKSRAVIENGSLNEKEMAKLRLTVDQLEMNLRQKNVTNISDVETATLEPSGQLGFTLKQEAQPDQLTNQMKSPNTQQNQDNIFAEVKKQGHQYTPPEHLQ